MSRAQFVDGSLYALETALHEWMLDSPLRTRQPHEAHLFFVPVYLSSLFIHPIAGFADEPYLGSERHESRTRCHQGVLLLLRALAYIRTTFPFWNASGGRDHVWMLLHDEAPCWAPRELRPSILLTHYGYYADRPRAWTTYGDDNWLSNPRFYARYIGDPARPTACIDRAKDLVVPPWKVPSFWQRALSTPMAGAGAAGGGKARGVARSLFVFFAGEMGRKRRRGYSRDLRQTAYSLFCDPHTTARANCSVHAGGCRTDLPMHCARWRPGVLIAEHTKQYHKRLLDSTFCLAFPGDGWSSRVLDALVHGCIPVIVEDQSLMFFEGVLAAVGVGVDYEDFAVRLREAELPHLLRVLDAIPPARRAAMQRAVDRVRDYFVWKDVYAPYRYLRKEHLSAGRYGQDAFLLLTLALELRARELGTKGLAPRAHAEWRARNRELLGLAANASSA